MHTTSVRFIRISLALAAALLLLFVTFTTLTPTKAIGTLPNGVAAGDTTQTSAVLWARATTAGTVLFEYSTDPNLNSNVLTVTTTTTGVLQPVKAQITGLSPETTYFYRVTDAANVSGQGQFRTAAEIGTYSGLRFGVSGDWKAELAPYPSIANAGERNLDFFVEHGDTIVAGSATTVGDFRLEHSEVYSTYFGLNTWAGLRSSTSILATIDDNDVRNDFAGGAHPSSDLRFDNTGNFINETNLYTNALQAFQEYNPLRDEFYGVIGDNRTDNNRKLYRFNTYGRDAAVFVLDTRSFRDEQLDPPTTQLEVLAFLTNSFNDTSRTILGARQLADLKAGLSQAQTNQVTWKFVLTPSPIQNLGLFKAEDRWEGYAAERKDLLAFIGQNGIENVVFVAAGLHGTVVNNLTYQNTFPGAQISTGAFEVVVGPVAIDPPSGPFGPVAVEMAFSAGLISQSEKDTYDALSREGKDDFVRQLINEDLLDPLDLVVDYDYVGLDGSGIDATLLQGGYVAAHTYGWTEFDIDQYSQILTVTTYGIDYYTQTLLIENPNDIITRTPTIVSQFVVTPTNFSPLPDLSITKTAVPASGSVEPGDWITYTISVVNNGGPASNVVISDTLDLGKVTLATSQTTMGILNGPNPVQIAGFDLETGQMVTLTLGVTVTISSTTITNIATVDSSDQTALESSNAVNHSAQEPGSGSGTSSVYLPLVIKDL